MAGATRKTLHLMCLLVLVAFGDARLRDRKSRQSAPGEEVKETVEVTPPADLKVETLSNTSIKATWWYSFPPPFNFLLSCCLENETHCPRISISGDVQAYTFKSLAPATKYEIRVSAWDSTGESRPVVANATTYANAPDVTGLKLEVLGNSSIEVRWNMPEVPVSRFEIVTCPVVPGHPCVDATAKDKSSYIVENLKPGTEYEVKVQSVIQKRDFTSYGVPAKARATTDYYVPSVTNLALTCPADGVIVAEWTLEDPSSVDTISIIACPLAKYDCRKATVGPQDKSVEFKSLLADEEYTVNVTTFLTVGNTTYHGKSMFDNTRTPPKPPSKVVNLMHEIINVTRLNASWEEPANQTRDVAGYFLSCEKGGGHEVITHKVQARSHRVTTHLNLNEPLSEFTCSVWAYVVYNETIINGTSTEFPVETESPAPSEVRNVRFNVLNVTTLNASWDRPTEAPWGISSYVVRCKSADTNRTISVTFADEEEYVIKLVDLHEQLTRFGCSVFAYVQVGGQKLHGK
uniref:Putative cell adhesion molecule n=1 Tax=Ixodes ricinus TaxID=34613 RepID=A0A0K8R3W5_IXORI